MYDSDIDYKRESTPCRQSEIGGGASIASEMAFCTLMFHSKTWPHHVAHGACSQGYWEPQGSESNIWGHLPCYQSMLVRHVDFFAVHPLLVSIGSGYCPWRVGELVAANAKHGWGLPMPHDEVVSRTLSLMHQGDMGMLPDIESS